MYNILGRELSCVYCVNSRQCSFPELNIKKRRIWKKRKKKELHILFFSVFELGSLSIYHSLHISLTNHHHQTTTFYLYSCSNIYAIHSSFSYRFFFFLILKSPTSLRLCLLVFPARVILKTWPAAILGQSIPSPLQLKKIKNGIKRYVCCISSYYLHLFNRVVGFEPRFVCCGFGAVRFSAKPLNCVSL